MADLTTKSALPRTDVEYMVTLAFHIRETQILIDQMHLDQQEIERLKQKSCNRDIEIESLKSQTRAVLANLEILI